jgi:hypothetical protein
VDTSEFVKTNVPVNTRKSTDGAVRLFNLVGAELGFPGDLDSMTTEELPKNLATFFQAVTREGGKLYNASSLQTHHQSLVRYLKDTREIDILSDPRFNIVTKVLKIRQAESTSAGEVRGKHGSKAIQPKHFAQALKQGKFGAGSPQALNATIVKILMGLCGFRARDEIRIINNCDLIPSKECVDGVPNSLQISERISKMLRGAKGTREITPTIYANHNDPAICPVRSFMK